jgi:hypothetical protein
MNALTKVTLNVLMMVVVVAPFAVVIGSASADAACHHVSGKPGRLEPGGSRAVPQNLIQEVKS